MIKKLDILIIRSFIGPFIVTFFVSLFVLIMQFFWLYMDEMIGKGISIWMLMKLLVYMSTTLVPLALPLSILLSSIMTFGNMGENFELVAIKSSGISLLRFMSPLLIFVMGIAGLAFLFSNNVIPVANLKALTLLYDVRNSKPTLNIRPDQFNNEIQGYSIRVGSKDQDGNTIHDVVIYDHTDLSGNNKVILAKEGQMIASSDKQSLIFKLRDGWRYEEGTNRGIHDLTQTRMHFAKWDKMFDLSSLNFTRTNVDMFKNESQMMNVKQLSGEIDSLKKYKIRSYNSISGYIAPYITINNKSKEGDLIIKKIHDNKPRSHTYDSSFLQIVPDSSRTAVLQTTINNLRNFKALMDVTALSKKLDSENYLKFDVEFHRKFTLSFACILLFLIGAPLGAIIRKGGLGMPLVIAVIFFMAFHILNITGEKLAKTAAVMPWMGMWMSTFLLLPLAFWLIISARNDSQIFTKEWYIRIWRLIKNILHVKKDSIA
ncbi:MAG: LptF/LptG family permease [Chitinophagales bacterium]